MFWIHGGAGRWGSGHEGNYTSSYLPNQGDVIVVTIQYRLGIFGWLAHPNSLKNLYTAYQEITVPRSNSCFGVGAE